jgi:hypothetical protein
LTAEDPMSSPTSPFFLPNKATSSPRASDGARSRPAPPACDVASKRNRADVLLYAK